MLARALIYLIQIYQLTLSKILPPACRFEPSCSRYATECLRLHGAGRGSWLAVRRISRCHPFHPGGYDPPPSSGGFTPRPLKCPTSGITKRVIQRGPTPEFGAPAPNVRAE